jgi:hypothetical protein
MRLLYAGNAVSKVKSKDAVKLITVRTTAFPAANAAGGSAGKEDIAAVSQDKSEYNGAELTKVQGFDSGQGWLVECRPLFFFWFLVLIFDRLVPWPKVSGFCLVWWARSGVQYRVFFHSCRPAFPCRATYVGTERSFEIQTTVQELVFSFLPPASPCRATARTSAARAWL